MLIMNLGFFSNFSLSIIGAFYSFICNPSRQASLAISTYINLNLHYFLCCMFKPLVKIIAFKLQKIWSFVPHMRFSFLADIEIFTIQTEIPSSENWALVANVTEVVSMSSPIGFGNFIGFLLVRCHLTRIINLYYFRYFISIVFRYSI